jgi:hypothetical protein
MPPCPSRPSISMYNICNLQRVFQMRIVEFAEMLQGSINEKIKDCRESVHKAHNPIYNQSLEVEIETLQWVQTQIQHLVINNEKKTRKYGFD